MEEEISLEEYQESYREMRIKREKKGFLAHITAYILVNIMLMAINFTYTPETTWFFYPLIGWGIGVVFHYLNATRWIKNELKEKEAMAEKMARDKQSS